MTRAGNATKNQREGIIVAPGSTNFIIVALALLTFVGVVAGAQSGGGRCSGTVLDPGGRAVAGARVELDSASGARLRTTTGSDGAFRIDVPAWGAYTVRVAAKGFSPIERKMDLSAATTELTLRLEAVAGAAEEVIVLADVSDIAIASPDPSEKVLVREELLDANPGRPGAPISIPGMPIETAAGGIKAPQYFVPGVAGDHGEPIAQYIAVGGYLVPNNLSANAHGNGYADPNIYVSGALGSVGTDGGAYNVLEGNHALNMAATYSLRPRLERFLTLTGDDRDADLTAGYGPSDPAKREWVAVEANHGNGLMRMLEHRQQYKWNAMRAWDPGKHEITLFSAGYYGKSHEGNLVPIGFGVEVDDTLDSRQQDQTHSSIVAADDRWKVGLKDEVGFSGFFRTYNLGLFSNFGEGLIRQSEFRTVEGAEARETHSFRTLKVVGLEALAGIVYNEDDLHNDNLDHFLSAEPSSFGSFVKVLANNVTIRELATYVALDGDLGRHLRFYAGLREERIEMKNTDKLKPADSFDEWKGFAEPKATVTWSPGAGPAHWLPSASFSVGQAFFTEDPRISVAGGADSGAAVLANPFERSHSEQLALEKEIAATDVRVTVGRTTTTATLAKIDPDDGLAEDLGPGTLKFLTASVRHTFGSYGTLQAIFSKADARLVPTATTPGEMTPEAPRTIFDALSTVDRLPLGLHARGEYEYVGHKFLDGGNAQHPGQFEAIPVNETRLAVVRPFLNGRLELGADGMLARGYTGQTTETLNPGWTLGQTPYCAPGSGPSGLVNDFACGTNEMSVGIRMVSWMGGSVSWRFGGEK
jgi:hypothetical protein